VDLEDLDSLEKMLSIVLAHHAVLEAEVEAAPLAVEAALLAVEAALLAVEAAPLAVEAALLVAVAALEAVDTEVFAKICTEKATQATSFSHYYSRKSRSYATSNQKIPMLELFVKMRS